MRQSRGALGLACVSMVACACGARSALDDASDAGGGAGPTRASVTSTTVASASTTRAASSTDASAQSTSSGLVACTTLVHDAPAIVVPTTTSSPLRPDLAALPGGDTLLTWVTSNANLQAYALDTSGAWPPAFEGETDLGIDAAEYVLGAGVDGPIAHTTGVFGKTALFAPVWPVPQQLLPPGAPLGFGGESLFAAAVPGRWLFGRSDDAGEIQVMSLDANGALHIEAPSVCVTRALAGAAASGPGFLAVIGRPFLQEPSCDVGIPRPPEMASVVRYDPSIDGAPLVTVVHDQLVMPEPLLSLKIVPASFGAWIVYQTDGSTSVAMPGIHAVQVDRGGQLRDPSAAPIAVSPDGLPAGPIAVAPMGDAVVVTYPGATADVPILVVQRVEPEGTLGPRAEVATDITWLTGQVRALASADRIVVTWEGGNAVTSLGLARFSCAAR